jgi:predicted transcriptional regulator
VCTDRDMAQVSIACEVPLARGWLAASRVVGVRLIDDSADARAQVVRPASSQYAIRDSRIYCEFNMKAQDLLVVLKLAATDGKPTFPQLAAALGMSASEVHGAVARAMKSGLLDASRAVKRSSLREFLVHGLSYVFPAERSGVTRGIPTSSSAPPLQDDFGVAELPPVWPHPMGTVRGEGLAPLYRSAPEAALRDPRLYEWLALVDAVRAGRAREKNLAIKEIERRLA